MLIDNMPEIPGIGALGNVADNDFRGDPVDLALMAFGAVRKMGPLAFGLFVIYACQLVFFAVLGMGWSWGYSHKYFGAISGWNYTPHMTIGSSALHVAAGQRIILHYDTQIEKGCIRYYLSPIFGMPYHAPNTDGKITGGSGDAVLIAPASGWVSLRTFTDWGCNAAEMAEIRANFGGPGHIPLGLGQNREIAKYGYKLSWRLDLSKH